MKNLNPYPQNLAQVNESKAHQGLSSEAAAFSDLNVNIYNELHDQTQSSVNVLEMIQNQFNQIYEMNQRRSFILKEVSQYLIKS